MRTPFLIWFGFSLIAQGFTPDLPSDDYSNSVSFFESKLAQSKGPFPTQYENLVKLFDQPLKKSSFGFVRNVDIPDGRSLQKKHADIFDPRIVSAFDYDKPLFIGFAPLSSQLEVISWTPDKGRYDFFLVLDYAPGKTPHIQPANRAFCMKCHQAGGPIFSRDDWSEVMGNHHIFDLAAIEKKKSLKVDLKMESGFLVDETVRKANHALQAERVCRTACQNDIDCQLRVLEMALLANRLRKQNPDLLSKREEALTALLKDKWPRDQFAYPSSVLPNRNPFQGNKHGGDISRLHSWNNQLIIGNFRVPSGSALRSDLNAGVDPVYLEPLSRSPISSLGNFQNYTDFDSEASGGDPELPRPLVGRVAWQSSGKYLSENAPSCFGLEETEHAEFSQFSTEALTKATWSPNVKRLVETGPMKTRELRNAYRAALLGEAIETQPKSAEPRPPVTSSAAKTDILSLYQRYCAHCHQGEKSDTPLAINNVEDLRRYKTKTGISLIEKIKKREMPLAIDEKDNEAWEKDRLLMLQLLN